MASPAGLLARLVRAGTIRPEVTSGVSRSAFVHVFSASKDTGCRSTAMRLRRGCSRRTNVENSRLSFDDDRTLGSGSRPASNSHYGKTPPDVREQPIGTRESSRPQEAEPRYEDRFEKVRAAERSGAPQPDKGLFGRRFNTIALPTPDSNGDDLLEYWRQANRAGVPVTVKDLESYDDLVRDNVGKSVLIDGRNDDAFSPGLRKMGARFAAENPADVKRTENANKLAAMRVRDNREEVAPGAYCSDLDPGVVTADKRRLGGDLAKLSKMAPLARDASPETVATYRAAARAVGVRLKIEHVEEHQFGDSNTYRRPGQSTPLGVELLKDLERNPEQRQLLRSTPEQWEKVLRERQPLPKPQRFEDVTRAMDSAQRSGDREIDDRPYDRTPLSEEETARAQQSSPTTAADQRWKPDADGLAAKQAPPVPPRAALGRMTGALEVMNELQLTRPAVDGKSAPSTDAQLRWKPNSDQLASKPAPPKPPHRS